MGKYILAALLATVSLPANAGTFFFDVTSKSSLPSPSPDIDAIYGDTVHIVGSMEIDPVSPNVYLRYHNEISLIANSAAVTVNARPISIVSPVLHMHYGESLGITQISLSLSGEDQDGLQFHFLTDLMYPTSPGFTIFDFPEGDLSSVLGSTIATFRDTAFKTSLFRLQSRHFEVAGNFPLIPLPETDSWIMMIGGFALAGAAMRRRYRVSFAQ